MVDNDDVIVSEIQAALVRLCNEKNKSPIINSTLPNLTINNGAIVLPLIIPPSFVHKKLSQDKLLKFTISVLISPNKEKERSRSDDDDDDNNNNNNNNKKIKLIDENANSIKVLNVYEGTNLGIIRKEISECLICYEKAGSCVFGPCGHLVCCFECGVRIYFTRNKCPVCTQPIRKVVRICHHYHDASLDGEKKRIES